LDSIFFRFQNQVLSCRNGSILRYLSKLVLFMLTLFLPVYCYHIWDIWMLFDSLFFGKLTYVLKEEDTNIIRGIPQIYNDNRNIKQQMATG